MTEDLYRLATREELDLAVEWAAREGWNPGLDDADLFWESDPEGFVAIERDGEVIGTGSVVSYGKFGFMGFFIVREDLRGQGIGAPFWRWRKQHLFDRLEPGSAIGMDGVFDMQPFYAKGGFEFTHRNIRMEGAGESAGTDADGIVSLSDVPYEAVAELDRRCFGFERDRFLEPWIQPHQGTALGAWRQDRLEGFGVIRQCRTGHKIGPLFAEKPETAETLFRALSSRVPGEPIFLDTPENNPEALALAERHGMKEVFGCARMIAGPIPPLPWQDIYGVTTFELG